MIKNQKHSKKKVIIQKKKRKKVKRPFIKISKRWQPWTQQSLYWWRLCLPLKAADYRSYAVVFKMWRSRRSFNLRLSQTLPDVLTLAHICFYLICRASSLYIFESLQITICGGFFSFQFSSLGGKVWKFDSFVTGRFRSKCHPA